MANQKITDQRTQTSRRHRLNLLEEISRDVVTYTLGATAIPVATGNDTTWFTGAVTAACQCAMSGPTENDSDQTFATLITNGTVNTMQLAAGRYKVTMNVTVKNTHATNALDYRFALTDNATTEVAYFNSNTVDITLPASTQNHTVSFSKIVLLDLSAQTIINYAQAAEGSGQTAALVRSVSSEILVERLG
tara:strand:- start:6182 stop:6754 length:573 start_codon:yes stop_codon:yes gene_type:complete